MKFTANQLEFLRNKINISIDDLISEASVFVAPKKQRNPVADSEKCKKIKKNGMLCSYKAKVDGMCGKHVPKVETVVSDSSEYEIEVKIEDKLEFGFESEVEVEVEDEVEDKVDSLSDIGDCEENEEDYL